MTQGQLAARVAGRIEGYSAAQIDSVLNEGLRLFSFLTLCVERTVTVPLSENLPEWQMLDVIADWIAPLRLMCRVVASGRAGLFDTDGFDEMQFDQPGAQTQTVTPVRPATLQELGALDREWKLARDGPVARYGVQGIDYFFIYPAPSRAETTSLIVTYAAEASPMVSAESVPEIPEEFHPALVDYALCTLPMRFGGSELSRMVPRWDMFMQAVQQCASYIRNRNRAHQYDTVPPELVLAAPKPASKKAGESK
jgi:hypothetical protein